MAEYFIVANSFAAPFCSDTSTHFHEGDTAGSALNDFAVKGYKHPCGLYSAAAYDSAEAYHKGVKPLQRWLSNHARAIEESGATSIRSDGPGLLTLNGKSKKVKYPKSGQLA